MKLEQQFMHMLRRLRGPGSEKGANRGRVLRLTQISRYTIKSNVAHGAPMTLRVAKLNLIQLKARSTIVRELVLYGLDENYL